jgi:hypothetical protein
MVEQNYRYKIIIKKKCSCIKDKIIVLANTKDLGDIEELIQEKLTKTYFSIVTENSKVYIIDTYDIEKIEVLPL